MPLPVSTNWIISRREDLIFLILSSFGAYVLLGLMLASPAPALVWFLWAALLDTPHYFGTYSRAYLDPTTRLEHPGRFRVGHSLLVLGPGIVILCALLYAAGVESYRQPLLLFVFLFNLWAYWHLVRQHYGIMMLYKRRSDDHAPADRMVDLYFLYGGLLASLLILGMRHPEARTGLGLDPSAPPFTLIMEMGARAPVDLLAAGLAWAVVVTATAVFVGRQLFLVARGRTVVGPKVLFMVAVVSSYVCVSAYEPGYQLPLILWTGAITIGHDLQYFAFVYFQHRRRYHGSALRAEPSLAASWARRVSANPWRFVGIAVLVGGSLRLLGAALGVFPDVPTLVNSAEIVLFGQVRLQDLFFTVMLGIAMHHYWMDQFLWRPSRDVGLRRDLGLTPIVDRS